MAIDASIVGVTRALARVAVPLVALAVGLAAGQTQLTWLLRRRGLLARSLLAALVLEPLATILLVWAVPVAPEVRRGLIVASLAVGPIAALRNAGKAGGHVHYALDLNVVLLIASVVYVPVAVAAIGAAAQQALRLPVRAVIKPVLALQLLPLAAGLALARLSPRAAARAVKPVGVLGNALLGLVALALFLLAIGPILRLGATALLTTAAAAVLAICIGHALGGPAPDTRRVLASFCAVKFPALAILISTVIPQGRRVLPVVVAYIFVSLAALAVHGALGRLVARRRSAPAAHHASAGAA